MFFFDEIVFSGWGGYQLKDCLVYFDADSKSENRTMSVLHNIVSHSPVGIRARLSDFPTIINHHPRRWNIIHIIASNKKQHEHHHHCQYQWRKLHCPSFSNTFPLLHIFKISCASKLTPQGQKKVRDIQRVGNCFLLQAVSYSGREIVKPIFCKFFSFSVQSMNRHLKNWRLSLWHDQLYCTPRWKL